MRLDLLDPVSQQKFVISKIQHGGGGHLANRKIAISLLWIDQFQENSFCALPSTFAVQP